MTPDQYRTAIERLGLTQAQAAKYLGVSLRTSHGYANGDPIPVAVHKLFELLFLLKQRDAMEMRQFWNQAD